MNAGSRIKQIRENQAGLSMKKMAQILGINASEYNDIEKGISDITLTRLEEIAAILGVTPQYILSGRTSPVFVNNFYNGAGNKGTINIIYQGRFSFRIIQLEKKQEITEQAEILDITPENEK